MLDVEIRDRVIVALDCSVDRARELAHALKGHGTWLKVGMTLYYAAGPSIVDEFKAMGFKTLPKLTYFTAIFRKSFGICLRNIFIHSIKRLQNKIRRTCRAEDRKRIFCIFNKEFIGIF